MKFLGIDTAGAVASVALVEDGRLIGERRSRNPAAGSPPVSTITRSNHAESVLPLIDSLLRDSGLSVTDLAAIAVSIGPGSFTGLRIGLGTVKGIAYGWDLPVIEVSTLLANAARVTDREGWICPFIDAKRGEVYSALARKKGDSVERLTADLVTAPETVVELVRRRIGADGCLFVGDGIKAYGGLLAESFGRLAVLALGDDYPSVASAVAQLGEAGYRRGEVAFLGDMAPFYLRSSEAESRRGNSELSG